jgi:hypothetical protein
MKHFTKQIHTILYSMHDLLWVVIGLLVLLGLTLIASTDSWLYLLLFLPLLVYIYGLKAPGSLNKKIRRMEKTLRRWFIKFVSTSQKTSGLLNLRIRKLEQNLEPWFFKFISTSQKASGLLKIKIRKLQKSLQGWLIKFRSTVQNV